MVKTVTKGTGVDLVLNSLAEDKLEASIRCLKSGGRFIEVGKYDMIMNHSLGWLQKCHTNVSNLSENHLIKIKRYNYKFS